MRAFQVDDRLAHGADRKRKGWVDDGRIRPDAEWHAGWMTDGSGRKRKDRVDDGRFRPYAKWRSGWMRNGSGGKRKSRVVGMDGGDARDRECGRWRL